MKEINIKKYLLKLDSFIRENFVVVAWLYIALMLYIVFNNTTLFIYGVFLGIGIYGYLLISSGFQKKNNKKGKS